MTQLVDEQILSDLQSEFYLWFSLIILAVLYTILFCLYAYLGRNLNTSEKDLNFVKFILNYINYNTNLKTLVLLPIVIMHIIGCKTYVHIFLNNCDSLKLSFLCCLIWIYIGSFIMYDRHMVKIEKLNIETSTYKSKTDVSVEDKKTIYVRYIIMFILFIIFIAYLFFFKTCFLNIKVWHFLSFIYAKIFNFLFYY